MLPSLMFVDAAPHGLPMCLWSITEYMHTSSWNSQSSSNSITARPQNVTRSIPLALVTHHVRLYTMGHPKVTNATLVVFKCLWIFFSWTCICLCSDPMLHCNRCLHLYKYCHICYNCNRCFKDWMQVCVLSVQFIRGSPRITIQSYRGGQYTDRHNAIP